MHFLRRTITNSEDEDKKVDYDEDRTVSTPLLKDARMEIWLDVYNNEP